MSAPEVTTLRGRVNVLSQNLIMCLTPAEARALADELIYAADGITNTCPVCHNDGEGCGHCDDTGRFVPTPWRKT